MNLMTKTTKILLGLTAISLGAMAISYKKLICGLRGHDDLMEFGKHRLYLFCANCGWSSPGWEIGKSWKHKESNVKA